MGGGGGNDVADVGLVNNHDRYFIYIHFALMIMPVLCGKAERKFLHNNSKIKTHAHFVVVCFKQTAQSNVRIFGGLPFFGANSKQIL